MVERAAAEENRTVHGLKWYLSWIAVRRAEAADAQRKAVKQREQEVASKASPTVVAMTPEPASEDTGAGAGRAGAAPLAPTSQPVIQTVYREVQVPTPSRLAGFVESRLGWLLLGVLVIGIVAGFATRGSGSRQIVISPEEHARAAAALEQRLRADALRIQRLSSAVDEEEARFIQRVSAITGRS
ncbi:MAG: hypothetical protein IPN03_18510 [Holophagales bacterium]|nr:hypothetical protein [Holophagales bacterium]